MAKQPYRLHIMTKEVSLTETGLCTYITGWSLHISISKRVGHPDTLPILYRLTNATGAERTAALKLRASGDKRWDRAAAILVTSISDEDIHTVQAVDRDPIQLTALHT